MSVRQVVRPIVAFAAIMVIAASVEIASAEPAHADPFNCHLTQWGSWGIIARCDSGSGTYRAVTRCDKWLAPDYTRYGPEVSVGNDSGAYCNTSDRAYNYGVQIIRR
jgi:hypothetical protein